MCSDVKKAFLTSSEVSEFNKLKEYLIQKSYDNNKLYELDIILTKCSERFDNIYEKTKEKFSEHNILLFNAFGRSYHHKNFVEEIIGIPSRENINFSITNYESKNIELIETIFFKKMKEYSQANRINLDELIHNYREQLPLFNINVLYIHICYF